MTWKNWFHEEAEDTIETIAEVLPFSPRLLDGIELDKLSIEVREFFEERAAIREFDGNMSRNEAETGAWEDIQPYIESEQQWSFDEWLRNS